MKQDIYTIYKLIYDLQHLIEDNPETNFNEIDIAMNSEYTCGGVELRFGFKDALYVNIVGG